MYRLTNNWRSTPSTVLYPNANVFNNEEVLGLPTEILACTNALLASLFLYALAFSSLAHTHFIRANGIRGIGGIISFPSDVREPSCYFPASDYNRGAALWMRPESTTWMIYNMSHAFRCLRSKQVCTYVLLGSVNWEASVEITHFFGKNRCGCGRQYCVCACSRQYCMSPNLALFFSLCVSNELGKWDNRPTVRCVFVSQFPSRRVK